MTRGLLRFHESRQPHHITFSCYHRLPYFTEPRLCQTFLEVLERMRNEFRLRVYAYVVMPEHVHVLLSEPELSTLADFMHSSKLSLSKLVRPFWSESGAFWQKRYYDRNIRTHSDFLEKVRYIHRNPVRRGLCAKPEDWPWSSFRHYATGEAGIVEIDSEWTGRKRSANTIQTPG